MRIEVKGGEARVEPENSGEAAALEGASKLYLTVELSGTSMLKQGPCSVSFNKLTEAEFQDLCHDLSSADHCRFRAGCRAYWQQLGMGSLVMVWSGTGLYELTQAKWVEFLQDVVIRGSDCLDLSNYGIEVADMVVDAVGLDAEEARGLLAEFRDYQI